MDSSYKFQQGAEKSKYRRVDRITTLFRFAEAFVLLIVLYRFCSSHFGFSLKLLLCTQYFSTGNLISPRSVFVVGNVIVIVLLFISGQIKGGKSNDFYDEYVEKCGNINNNKEASDTNKVLSRTHSSAHVERSTAHVRGLRRSKSDQCRKKAAVEAEMSGEQFRLTVEAFIARHKCCLREEEQISA